MNKSELEYKNQKIAGKEITVMIVVCIIMWLLAFTVYSAICSDGNDDAKLVMEKYYYSDGSRYATIYKYDNLGNCTREKEYKNIEKTYDASYGYDIYGNTIKYSIWKIDVWGDTSSASYYYENEYDSNGNLVIKSSYYSNGDKSTDYRYKYNSKGNVIWAIEYSRNGKISRVSRYEYDNRDNVISETRHIFGLDVTYKYKYEYDYAENGNSLKMREFQGKNDEMYLEYEYEYDSMENMIKRITYRDNGDIYSVDEYEYNESGQLLRECTTYTDDFFSNEEYEYKYDSMGNMIKCTKYIYNDEGERTLNCHETKIYKYNNIAKQIYYMSKSIFDDFEFEIKYKYDCNI
jgi:hypothetical protein